MEIRSYLYMQNSKQDASKESLCGLSTTMQGGKWFLAVIKLIVLITFEDSNY